MTEPERAIGSDESLDPFRLMAETSLKKLGHIYLGQEWVELQQSLKFEIRSGEGEQGQIVPLTRFDGRNNQLAMIIEPETIVDYAEQLEDEVNHGVEVGDIVKLLIGAGVARCIAGWKATKARLSQEQQADDFKELLCRKDELWAAADVFDTETERTVLRSAVERLGDGQIIRVNILRFAFGAALNHLFEPMDLQQLIIKHTREELMEKELLRQKELTFNLSWLTSDSAFSIYDDSTPELELALSFPMTPGEERVSFAGK